MRSARESEIQREREQGGSDITIVALKLAMSSHSPLPKIRTIGDEFTLFFAKGLHFSFLPSHFLSLPFEMVIIVALKFAMSSHFPLPKNFTVSETNDRISVCTVLLLMEKMNQINTKNFWK